jgi:hypothetical protein
VVDASRRSREPNLSIEEQIYALKTWRYLRIAMAAMAATLFAAIIEERVRGHLDPLAMPVPRTVHCWQGSISAYYYTPVHAFLVGALVAIGICLFSLKGDTPVEDVLLNLAGMFAPVVALVPTDPPSQCPPSVVGLDRYANAANNMFALVSLETMAFLIILILVKIRRDPGDLTPPPPTKADAVGFKVAVGLVGVEWLFWALSFHTDAVYKKYTHYSSAILMFVCFFLVVCFRAAATNPHPFPQHLRRPELEDIIAILMVGSVMAFVVLTLVHWDEAVFQVEFCLIALFLAYWLVQTERGWHPEVGTRRWIVRKLSEPVFRKGNDLS